VGEGRSRKVDVRIIAATHRDLASEARAGRFRADLYYRLHVLTVRAPALRERLDDVPLLAAHIPRRLRDEGRPECLRITDRALERLTAHLWPGNVRELGATLERAVHALESRGTLTTASLGDDIGVGTGARPQGSTAAAY